MYSSSNDRIIGCDRCFDYRLPNFAGATVTVSAREHRTRGRGDAFLFLDRAAGTGGQDRQLTAERFARNLFLPANLCLT